MPPRIILLAVGAFEEESPTAASYQRGRSECLLYKEDDSKEDEG